MAGTFVNVDASLICFVLFALMLSTIWLGNRLRKTFWHPEEGDPKGGVNSLMGALFGLWSFLLAFSFNQSGGRFQTAQAMIVEESSILRNAIIKTDFFPDSIRTAYRADLRQYLEERISYYDDASDEIRFSKNREALTNTAKSLWARTVALSKNPDTSGHAGDMSGALANLFDIGIKREALLNSGMPLPIVIMLLVLALSISLVGGFTTPTIKRKEWIVITVFAFLASTVLFITIDLARPMDGFIKPEVGQQFILNLRKLF